MNFKNKNFQVVLGLYKKKLFYDTKNSMSTLLSSNVKNRQIIFTKHSKLLFVYFI